MRRIALFITLLALMLVGFFYLRRENPLPESVLTEPKIASPQAQTQTPAVMPVTTARVPAPAPTFYPSSKSAFHPHSASTPNPTLEFRIIDGLAVAQGDIILGKPQEPIPDGRGWNEPSAPQLWDRPEIPYAIAPALPNPERVEKALAYLRQHTPVNFVPYQGQPDAILFEPGSEHCLSPLGRVGGVQPIRLSPGCFTQEILHEILHSLGFVHEQSRRDRDQYIEILWDNIEEPYLHQFAIAPEVWQETLRGTSFDYRSIMIYRPNAFALRPELITLRSRGTEKVQPVAEGLSEGDIRRLNRMFTGVN